MKAFQQHSALVVNDSLVVFCPEASLPFTPSMRRGC